MAYVEALTEFDMEFGLSLWRALKRNKKFPARGALWLRQSDTSDWHLMIASERVDQVGPRRAYEELNSIASKVAESNQVLRIELVSPNAPFYQALRSVFGKTASVEGARLGSTQVGGMYIEDAYLYEIR